MIRRFIEIAAQATEIAGVLAIVGGLLFATARYAVVRAGDGLQRYKRHRHDLGRAILLGLEILVAADIISTVTLELDGRWPWQRGSSPS